MKQGIDYIGTSSGGVVFDHHGKIFMAKRGKMSRDDIGKREFPGGGILLHEDRLIAVKRNIKEKYGFNIQIEKILGVYDVIDKDFGDHWISTTYVCKYESGKPKIIFPDKCSEIGWFNIDEIKKMNLSRITKLNLFDLLDSRTGI